MSGSPESVLRRRARAEPGRDWSQEEGQWRFDRSLEEPKLPDSASAAVGATIDRLPRDEKLALLLGAYAAYHRLFYDAPIRRMPHAEGLDLAAALERLVERGLISEETPYTLGAWGIVPDTNAYSFATVLVREVAHDMVPVRERAELHLTFADRLREVSELSPDTRCLLSQIEAGHLFDAWRVGAARGDGDAELGRRALAACLAAAETREQREAGADLERAAAIAREVAPERVAEIEARLAPISLRATTLAG